ncbi:dynamin family protein [Arthrobacter sp. H14]|uniref:dynamin family protein n=1 Tax=Arthrobacter sp. H14 TaxID=1312959 RepID=UPI000478D089|nr:dynamin family protein [Arthrobacter sp. H14]
MRSETGDAPPLNPNGDPVALLESVRRALETAALPLELPGAAAARLYVGNALAQLDDYVLPRYRSLDAPLLAVVGGSTGAGKSTLVNALVGHPVTRAGAIRPTTRQPILLHHPEDRSWFADQRVLPNLSRITASVVDPSGPQRPAAAVGTGDTAGAEPEPGAVTSLVMLGDDVVPRGVAVLDAPDIDSISDDNRRLAGQLLAAADLWLFVTTANRYADAVPWKLLLEAAARDITVAVVLDRVPEGVGDEVEADLRGLLERQGLGGAKVFVIPESPLDELGMLPADLVLPIRDWLEEIAADATSRAEIARRTLNGAVKALGRRISDIAKAEVAQQRAGERLAADVKNAYDDAAIRVLDSTKDGTLLRGEVLARWQDFVGTGEFFRAVESNVGRLRDRIGAFMTGKPAPAVKVESAIESGLQAVIVDEAAKAAEHADQRWRSDPAGRQLLGGDDLARTSKDLPERVAVEIRGWQSDLMELIRTEGQDKRFRARMLSFGVNGLGVALMIVVFASTAGLTGLEVGIAGGSAVVGQKLLEAIFGEDAVRRLAERARKNLKVRCESILTSESQRFLTRLDVLQAGSDKNLDRYAAALQKLGERA